MATPSSILAWRIPWTGEPGGVQSMGLQGVGHDGAASSRAVGILANTALEEGWESFQRSLVESIGRDQKGRFWWSAVWLYLCLGEFLSWFEPLALWPLLP